MRLHDCAVWQQLLHAPCKSNIAGSAESASEARQLGQDLRFWSQYRCVMMLLSSTNTSATEHFIEAH